MSPLVPFPFKAVIFDLDGVIVDTEAFHIEVEKQFTESLGLSVSYEELFSLVGGSQQNYNRQVVRWYQQAGIGHLTVEEAMRRYRAWRSQITCDYRSLLNPGVAETVAELSRRGVRMALASSSPTASIGAVLAACGLAGAFDPVVSGAELPASKPDPAIYLRTLEALGLPAWACCCVEDSVPGITAGKRAGLTVVAKREERFGFSQDAADVIIESVGDFIGTVETLAAHLLASGTGREPDHDGFPKKHA